MLKKPQQALIIATTFCNIHTECKEQQQQQQPDHHDSNDMATSGMSRIQISERPSTLRYLTITYTYAVYALLHSCYPAHSRTLTHTHTHSHVCITPVRAVRYVGSECASTLILLPFALYPAADHGGSPNSSWGILAHIYIRPLIETKRIQFYTRYTDDILIIYDIETTNHDYLAQYNNTMHANLQVSPTLESNGYINFLDLTINRRSTHVEIDIYRKPKPRTPLYISHPSTLMSTNWRPTAITLKECSMYHPEQYNKKENGQQSFTSPKKQLSTHSNT